MKEKNKRAVIFLNMGGPNNLDEVELFLKNMFNDPNIITVKNTFLRKIIASFIVTFRKKEAQENYKQIGGKSPLVENTKKFIKKLSKKDETIYFDFAMRYTPPFAKDVIKKIEAKNIDEILLFPLYPHYSTTTTKSSLEDFYQEAKRAKLKADIQHIKNFYKNEMFNKAIIKSIKKRLSGKNISEYDFIFSAHSLPKKIVDKGDPYPKEIKEHIEILKELFLLENMHFNKIHLAYQSKLGPVEWLEPSLENVLKSIKNDKAIIYPISFLLDNSETEQELHIEYANMAKELKYQEYIVCECLNDNDNFIDSIYQMVLNTPLLSSPQQSF